MTRVMLTRVMLLAHALVCSAAFRARTPLVLSRVKPARGGCCRVSSTNDGIDSELFNERVRAAVSRAATADDPYATVAFELLRHSRQAALPAASACPAEGVEYHGALRPGVELRWVFVWNHFINLQFAEENVGVRGCNFGFGTNLTRIPSTAYPVRMCSSAGFRRAWSFSGGPGAAGLGDQTMLNLIESEDEAHDIVGVVFPVPAENVVEVVPDLTDVAQGGITRRACAVGAAHFEWLGWPEPPEGMGDVIVIPMQAGPTHTGPASFDFPILQSHIDTQLIGALRHGWDFAVEWVNTIHDWSAFWLDDRVESRRPWVHQPRALEIDRLLRNASCSVASDAMAFRAHESAYARRHAADDDTADGSRSRAARGIVPPSHAYVTANPKLTMESNCKQLSFIFEGCNPQD